MKRTIPVLVILLAGLTHPHPFHLNHPAASRAAVLLSAPAYTGPSVDEQVDQADLAAAEAARVAAEAEVVRVTAVEAAARALRAVTPPPVTAPIVVGPIVVDVARWTVINRCEQGGDWYAYGRFGNGLTGGGGLGMSDWAWAWAIQLAAGRGVTLPSFVLDASPLEQMTAAQALFDVAGGSPWACKA